MWILLIFGSCRVGEALHPGPWSIGAINPTGLASKADVVVSQLPGVFAVSETHLTCTGVARFRQELKQQQGEVFFVHGAGAPPKSNSLTSTGGKHTGVGFVSSYPSRSYAGNWQSEVWQTARVQIGHFLVQKQWITGGVVYGHAFQAASMEVRKQTGSLIDQVIQRLDACSGPKFLAGDFNQLKHHVVQIEELESRGWLDIQDLAQQRWGISQAPTCKRTTRKDYMLLCPELQQHVIGVEVVNDIFPDHAILRATMRDLVEPTPIPMWYVPQKMDIPNEVVPYLEGIEDFECVHPENDVTQNYLAFWNKYEQSVDDILQKSRHPKMCPRQKGRATTLHRDFRVPNHCPIKSSRKGEPAPLVLNGGKVYKQWFVQWRRLINLARLNITSATLSHVVQHAKLLWRSIIRASGFEHGFRRWWNHRPVVHLSDPLFIPLCLPESSVVQAIRDAVGRQIKQMETVYQKQVQASRAAKYQRDVNLVFKDVKDASPQPVEVLLHKAEAKVVEIVDEASVVFEPRVEFVKPIPIHGGSAALNIEHCEEGQVWFSAEHQLQVGQTIFQATNVGSLDEIFQAFGTEWSKRWDKHQGLPEEHWEHIESFIDVGLPEGHMTCPQITVAEWKAAAASKPKYAAVGMDGVACQELAQMPDVATKQLLRLIDHIEKYGRWPDQVTHGSVHSLQKTEQASTVNQYRPITILSCTYRTWATIRGRQLLAHLGTFAPELLYGSVRGRSSSDMWYQMQLAIERTLLDGDQCVGAIADVTKAFNCLPRQPLIRAAIRLGVPACIIKPWVGMLTQLQRHFIVRNAYGPGLTSVTGFAEGCGLSVAAMLLCNLVLHRYMSLAEPSVRLWSYVDNWEITGEMVEDVQKALQRLEDFAALMDLSLDQSKSVLWALQADDRKFLRDSGYAVTRNVRDLGGHLQLSRQQTNATLVMKCKALKAVWSKLAISRAPLQQKCKVVRVKAWPRGLHACTGVHISNATFNELRSNANKALGLKRAGVNTKLFLALFVHPAHDPEGYAIQACIKAFRKIAAADMSGPYLQALTLEAERSRCPGPLGVLISRLEVFGWTHYADTSFVDQNGLVVDILVNPLQEVIFRAYHAFQQHIGQKMAYRTGFEGLQWVDPRTTCQNLKHLPVDQKGLLRQLMIGAFITEDHLGSAFHDPEELRSCKFCGKPDSIRHRHWECSATAESRSQISEESQSIIAKSPQCFRERGWAVEPAEVNQYKQLLYTIPDTTCDFHWAPETDSTLDVFPDGTGVDPRWPESRLVAWAWCAAVSTGCSHFIPVADGGIPGLHQTVVRAEAMAVLSILRFARKHTQNIRIWSDNDLVVTRFNKIQQGKVVVDSSTSDDDIWGPIQLILMQGSFVVTAHKVVSHQKLDNVMHVDRWICEGNNCADRHANRAIRNLPAAVCAMQQVVSKTCSLYRRAHRELVDHFVRVGDMSIQQPVARMSKPADAEECGAGPTAEVLDVGYIVQQLRGKTQTSLFFDGLERWLQWFSGIVDGGQKGRWISWCELLIHFQLTTGILGVRCRYTTTGTHRQWEACTDLDGYSFRKAVKDFAHYSANLIRQVQAFKVQQHRPSNPAFHLWCNCVFIQCVPEVSAMVGRWMHEVGAKKVFKTMTELDELPPAFNFVAPRSLG